MKKIILGTTLLLGVSISTVAQTNRINHYSHSGSTNTLHLFKSLDNMGCGEVLKQEYQPDTTAKIKTKEETDTNKVKVINSIIIPKAKKPRKGLSIEVQYDVHSVLNKF